jgi:hypothetical protein
VYEEIAQRIEAFDAPLNDFVRRVEPSSNPLADLLKGDTLLALRINEPELLSELVRYPPCLQVERHAIHLSFVAGVTLRSDGGDGLASW